MKADKDQKEQLECALSESAELRVVLNRLKRQLPSVWQEDMKIALGEVDLIEGWIKRVITGAKLAKNENPAEPCKWCKKSFVNLNRHKENCPLRPFSIVADKIVMEE